MTLTTLSGLPAHVLLVHALVVLAPFSKKGDRDPRSRARAAERNP